MIAEIRETTFADNPVIPIGINQNDKTLAHVHDGRIEPLIKITLPEVTRIPVRIRLEDEADIWPDASSVSLGEIRDNVTDACEIRTTGSHLGASVLPTG